MKERIKSLLKNIALSNRHRTQGILQMLLNEPEFLSSFNATNDRFYISLKPNFHRKKRRDFPFQQLLTRFTGKEPSNTGDLSRLYFLYWQPQHILEKNIPGAMAEVGVYKGSTAALLHELLPDRELHLFDTFEGFTADDMDKEATLTKTAAQENMTENFKDTSLADVRNYVGENNVFYNPGFFPDSAHSLDSEEQYALVHLDADLYAPTLAGCRYFYPKMPRGGLLIVHDGNTGYAGSRQAVEEFFADKPEIPILIPDNAGSMIIAKI